MKIEDTKVIPNVIYSIYDAESIDLVEEL